MLGSIRRKLPALLLLGGLSATIVAASGLFGRSPGDAHFSSIDFRRQTHAWVAKFGDYFNSALHREMTRTPGRTPVSAQDAYYVQQTLETKAGGIVDQAFNGLDHGLAIGHTHPFPTAFAGMVAGSVGGLRLVVRRHREQIAKSAASRDDGPVAVGWFGRMIDTASELIEKIMGRLGA